MFSYFFATNKAKHTICMQQPCQQGWISNLQVLPNGLILSWTSNEVFNLELYDPIQKVRVANYHLALSGLCRLVSISRERLLFVRERDYALYVFNSFTLERDDKLEKILGNQKIDFDHGIYIGEQQFITISDREYGKNALIRAHDLSTMTFNQPVTMGYEWIQSSFKDFGNGLFACLLRHHDKYQYRVGLFKREPGPKISFTQIDSFYAEKEDSGFGYVPGKFIGLPDGRILTYQEAGTRFQVWQSDGKCVDEWRWGDDVICHDKIFEGGFLNYQVVPFPDNEHLLILADTHHRSYTKKLFLFNMKTRVINPVEFNGLEPWKVEVLTNGMAAVHMRDESSKNYMLCIDFAEMLTYRKGVTAQLNRYLVPDVNRLVTSYISDSSPWVVEEEKKPNSRWGWW